MVICTAEIIFSSDCKYSNIDIFIAEIYFGEINPIYPA